MKQILIIIITILLSCQNKLEGNTENSIEIVGDSIITNSINPYVNQGKNEKKQSQNQIDTFYLPLDTAMIISMLNIKLEDNVSNIEHYRNSLDTIELVNAQFACDCQDWVSDQYWETNDLGKYGYFIEPANSEIQLFEEIGVFRNRVRFIGISEFDNERKLNTRFSDTINVFKYYAYEILLPAKVYGPLYYSGKTELPNSKEELIERSIITINN